MRKTILTLASMATAILLAGGVGGIATTQPAEAAFPGKNGKVAFVSNRDVGASEIYAMNPDGSGVTRLTFPTGGNGDPVFSPDGTKIAFKSGGNDIYVMNANGMNPDGTGAQRITNTAVVESDPTFSPDGNKIAFVASAFEVDGSQDFEIWVMNADGTGRTLLTNNTFPDTQPAWSPNGDKIAFVSARNGAPNFDTDRNVYVMTADGSGQTNLTPNSTDPVYQGHDEKPSWSPDGNQIAYSNALAGGEPEIWKMNANGAGKTNITDNEVAIADTEPSWSPDGHKIAYVGSATGTDRNIRVMNADGTGQRVLHANAANDVRPDWQQDSLPPDTTITSGPLGTVTSASASFAFSSSETGSTFQCSLDGVALASCVSPVNYTVADGSHTFRVQATDAAGNVDATPTSRTWTVDTTPPPPPPNVAPVARANTYTVNEDKLLRGASVLRNDSDANGNALTAQRVKNTTKGKLVFRANGTFTYKPKPNFFGTDSFTYRAFDGKAFSNVAKVTIKVRSQPN